MDLPEVYKIQKKNHAEDAKAFKRLKRWPGVCQELALRALPRPEGSYTPKETRLGGIGSPIRPKQALNDPYCVAYLCLARLLLAVWFLGFRFRFFVASGSGCWGLSNCGFLDA